MIVSHLLRINSFASALLLIHVCIKRNSPGFTDVSGGREHCGFMFDEVCRSRVHSFAVI